MQTEKHDISLAMETKQQFQKLSCSVALESLIQTSANDISSVIEGKTRNTITEEKCNNLEVISWMLQSTSKYRVGVIPDPYQAATQVTQLLNTENRTNQGKIILKNW